MKYSSLNDQGNYVLRLELGDDVHQVVQDFCAEKGISNASVEGIGSVDSPILAHYSIKTKQFTNKQLEGIYEVTSLVGNVAVVDDKPLLHAHVNVSDVEMRVLGGHLVSAKCSATLELIINSFPSRYRKTQDDAIGLKVWDLDTQL